MSIKDTLQGVKGGLDALLSFANGKTGKADADLGEAVRTLADGYGGGMPTQIR